MRFYRMQKTHTHTHTLHEYLHTLQYTLQWRIYNFGTFHGKFTESQQIQDISHHERRIIPS